MSNPLKSRNNDAQDELIIPLIDVQAAVDLLQSWFDEDPQAQRETWEYLKVALDEDRLSDRKLFS